MKKEFYNNYKDFISVKILRMKNVAKISSCENCTPDNLLLDSAPNLGPLISRWEI